MNKKNRLIVVLILTVAFVSCKFIIVKEGMVLPHIQRALDAEKAALSGIQIYKPFRVNYLYSLIERADGWPTVQNKLREIGDQKLKSGIDSFRSFTSLKTAVSDNGVVVSLVFGGTPSLDKLTTYIEVKGSDLKYHSSSVSGLRKIQFMVQGTDLYGFDGATAGEWKWKNIKSLSSRIIDDSVIFEVPFDTIGVKEGDQIKIVSTTVAADWSTEQDRMPRNSAAYIGFPKVLGDAVGGTSAIVDNSRKAIPLVIEAKGLVLKKTTPARDFTEFYFYQDGNMIKGKLKTAGDFKLSKVTVYLQNLDSKRLGFKPKEPEKYPGMEQMHYMIEGKNINKFIGKKATDWSWENIGEASVNVKGNTFSFEFDKKLLDSGRYKIVSVMIAADWSTLEDRIPFFEPVEVIIK